MRTIQEYLKECDRESIIKDFIFQYAFSPMEMMSENCRNITIGQITDYYKENLNKLIDRLISTEPKLDDDRWILLAHHSAEDECGDMVYCLYKESDIYKDEFPVSYGYEFSPFEEVVGFYVADTYLTQYEINSLIADFLHEVSWTGFEQEELEEKVENIIQSAEDAELHKDDPDYFITHEELMKRMEERFGIEFERKDPVQEEAWYKFIRHQKEYNEVCQKVEIEKLIESIRKEKEC